MLNKLRQFVQSGYLI